MPRFASRALTCSMRARLRGSLAARRACSDSRRPCGERANAATLSTSEGDMLSGYVPGRGPLKLMGYYEGSST